MGKGREHLKLSLASLCSCSAAPSNGKRSLPASSFCILKQKASLWSLDLLSLLPQVTARQRGLLLPPKNPIKVSDAARGAY